MLPAWMQLGRLCKAKGFIGFKGDSHEVALCLRLTLQGHVSPGEPRGGE
jgi:hypothetical protein